MFRSLVVALALVFVPGLAAAAPEKPPPAKKINPCNTPDRGWGAYERWDNISTGQVLLPQRGGVTAEGGIDVLVHFHGHEPIRKEFAPLNSGIVLVGVDLGISSAPYHQRFVIERTFVDLLRDVRTAMREHTGRDDIYIRRIGLSSWSAGFGATSQILKQPLGKKVDSVILLDSLYGSYKEPSTREGLREERVQAFVDFAQDAVKGRRFLYQTHSQIPTPQYASTREMSIWLLGKIGGELRPASRKDRLGLELVERFEQRSYRVRGYAGKDKPAHCGHIGIIQDVVGVHLRRRWRTPRALSTES